MKSEQEMKKEVREMIEKASLAQVIAIWSFVSHIICAKIF